MTLYTASIDYENAFDTVDHGRLFAKLMECGICSKVIDIINYMYTKIIASVKVENNISETLEISVGVKQREPLSALLFILFIHDITSKIDFNNLMDKDLNELSFYMLLFADDIVLFTTDQNSLKSQLNSINNYFMCNRS